MKYKNKLYFYIAIFLLLLLVYFNFNFSTFKEGASTAVPATKPLGWNIFANKAIKGFDRGAGQPITPEQCLKNCFADTGCLAFQYDYNQTNCLLKSYSPSDSGDPYIKDNAGLYSYKKTNNPANTFYPPVATTCPPPPPPPPSPTVESMAAADAAYKAALATGLNDADSRKAGASAGMNYLTSAHDDKNGDARIAGIAYAYAKKLGKTDAEADAAAKFAIAEMWKMPPGGFTGLNLYVNNHIEMAALTPFANSAIGTLPASNPAILPTNYALELNTTRNSGDTQYDMKTLTYTTPNDCVRVCESEPSCKGFVFDTRSYANSCILKSNWDGAGYAKAGLNSYKNIPRTQPPPPPPPPPPPSPPEPTCSDILKEQMQENQNKKDANAEDIKNNQRHIYEEAKTISNPYIYQLNEDTRTINGLQVAYDNLFKKKSDDRDAAKKATIIQLKKNAAKKAAETAATESALAARIPNLIETKDTTASQLYDLQRIDYIQEAVDQTEQEWNDKYGLLQNGIGTQISQKIGGYTPQHTLQQTMRDICDNVISSIGDTTKVLTDKMGNFVGPDGLLSKFNGFTNDNTLYSSIDKIDTYVNKKDNIIDEIFYTLTNYNENKNKLDASKNSVKLIPYDADTILNINRKIYCTSNYDDKLGQKLCCGLPGVLSEYNQTDQCGPKAKWCVKAPNKSHGFCSSNKPTNN
jgi:hypothetical protein